jgi:hypothetical protein
VFRIAQEATTQENRLDSLSPALEKEGPRGLEEDERTAQRDKEWDKNCGLL